MIDERHACPLATLTWLVGYTNTFIAIAEDCHAVTGQLPREGASGPTVARVQYDMLASSPGRWTQEDVLLASSAAGPRP